MPTPRKSTEDHLRDGTYKPSKHGPLPSAEPVEAERLRRPESLTGRAAAVWSELVKLLTGVVRKRDVPVLAELCRWVERSERIAAVLDAIDATDPAFGKMLVNAGIATDKVAKLSALFGSTPADRAKVRAVVAEGGGRGKVATRPRTSLDQQEGD